jgi:hypothetical protein
MASGRVPKTLRNVAISNLVTDVEPSRNAEKPVPDNASGRCHEAEAA